MKKFGIKNMTFKGFDIKIIQAIIKVIKNNCFDIFFKPC